MTEEEVMELTVRVDVDAVRAYRDAVGRKTRDVVAALGSAGLADLVSRGDAARAPRGFGALEGQPRAVELGTSAITHNAVHLGEAATIRSLAGFNIGI